MPLVQTPLCPILVQRDAELAALRQLLAAARGGELQCVTITGEAGIGKSRLLRELLGTADADGWQVLLGYCSERDLDFPFAPIVDALRQRLRSEDTSDAFGDETTALLELLPELNDHTAAALKHLPPEQSKRRTFEAIATLLAHWASEQPLVVALEDLHWADPTTLELLELLPRRLGGLPLLLLSTARSDERSPALVHTLGTLRRQRKLVEIHLERLDAQGVNYMLAAMLGRPPASAWSAGIYGRTNGNPFFVEELLSSSLDAAADWSSEAAVVPSTVRDTVIERLDRLPSASVALAELAAVLGTRFELELLLRVSDRAEDEVLPALEALVEQQILVEESGSGDVVYAFRHALTRDAIHSRLSAPTRRKMHRRVAETLEDTVHSRPIAPAELGYHFALAGEWERTLRYARQAGEQAQRLHATAETLVHYRRARDAALAIDADEAGELQLRCGRALATLGALAEAHEQLQQSYAFAQARGDLALEQAACYELAGLYASRDYRRARELAERALEHARELHDQQREGLALNRLGNVLTNLGRFDESLALHHQALALFETLDNRWGVADALDLLGMTHYLAGDVIHARAAWDDAAEIFAELDDPERLASALTSRGLYIAVLDGPCSVDAPPDAFRADAEHGLRICREIAWRSGEAYAQVALASAALAAGRFSAVQDHLDQALAISAEINHHQWTVIARMTRGLLFAELYDDERALEELTAARDLAAALASTQWCDRAEGWLARCRLRLNGSAAMEQALAPPAPNTGPPRSLAARRALYTLAELALAHGDGHTALARIDCLLAADFPARSPPAALLIRSTALAAIGRLDEADTELQRARQNALDMNQRLCVWRIAAARALLWQERDPTVSRAEAGLARRELTALAAEIADDEQRERFLAAPEVRPWLRTSARSRTARSDGPGGLTARELDVAGEVLAGLSNREIALRLSISERTVEMHVSNALGKLGYATRAQLAAWAATHIPPDNPGMP